MRCAEPTSACIAARIRKVAVSIVGAPARVGRHPVRATASDLVRSAYVTGAMVESCWRRRSSREWASCRACVRRNACLRHRHVTERKPRCQPCRISAGATRASIACREGHAGTT